MFSVSWMMQLDYWCRFHAHNVDRLAVWTHFTVRKKVAKVAVGQICLMLNNVSLL